MMNCKQVQQQLSLSDSAETAVAEAVETHLQTCAACAAFAAHLQRLETSLSLWNTLPAPELESRIFTHIAEQPMSASSIKSRFSALIAEKLWKLKEQYAMKRTVFWGVSTVAAVFVLTVSLQVSRGNTTLRRMGTAAKSVQSVHLIGWSCALSSDVAVSVDNGTVHSMADAMPHRIEGWIKDGHWRETNDFDVTLYRQGKTWRNGKLVPMETTPPLISAFAFRAVSGDDPFGKGIAYTTYLEANASIEGQPADKLTLETKGDIGKPERRIFWVDKATYLPLRMEALRFENERWALASVLSYDYNLPVADALFDPTQDKPEKARLHGTVPTAREIYRMTDEQERQWKQVLQDKQERSQQIERKTALSPGEKTAAEVQNGAVFFQEASRIFNADQRKLWSDWNRVVEEMGRKLWTPEMKKEDAAWHIQQRRLYSEWIATQDERTKQLLQGRDTL